MEYKNVINMGFIFYECSSLSLLPDISKWQKPNIIYKNQCFNECFSLLEIPHL